MARAHDKRSKGSRINPVAGAVVIRRGGGGGEKPQRRDTLEQAAEKKRMRKASANLITTSKADEEADAERLARITKRVKAGKARLKRVRR